MATASRSLWKGAISFGLVHIPVSLHSASMESGVDFDWLDKRSMDPVGYKRINKRTGREITKDNIVKGIEYENDKYVLLSDEEIEAVYPRSTQAIEIEAFVSMDEIPFVYLDRPYYLAPVGRGQKVYALLREALLKSGRIGLARVVIHTKQHLAALVPAGPALVLNLLRWSDEIRTWDDLSLPKEGAKANNISERELQMAGQLIDDMTVAFDPSQFADRFKEQVMALVERKVEAGETETVLEPEEEPLPTAGKGADVVDLTALLQQSLKGRAESKNHHKAAPKKKRAA
ncbi:Ku protein [Piscinibacter sp. HJYY11]|uniref:non-homologous end joining protein Ku n=1 Tax=Piscinibacter sp. HJYY11 TaxID=2801333 RepID=UPI00191F2991|nr:Ku protein [Piscinibacter sp. HJYY11]MBL0729950.1 Ku protein [Piscinibacter sp. HJYY11]